ncbi:hypothetical protein HDU98_011974 [Podochytrium sp. JEL0797]|nr:hypothetical protein HDU98_011974 [Podochytrium sp. JEL0797]
MHFAVLVIALSSVSAAPFTKNAAFASNWTAPFNPAPVALPSGKRLTVYYGSWGTYKDNYDDHPDASGPPYEDYQVADIPVSLLSDINYSFFTIANETINDAVINNQTIEAAWTTDPWADYGQVFNSSNPHNPRSVFPDTPDQAYFGNFGQFMKLKQLNEFNFGLSIGGWGGSYYFSTAMMNPAQFVDSIFENAIYAFPGLFSHVDVDWEYPQNTTTDEFGNGNQASVNDTINFAKFLQILRTRLDNEGLTNFQITTCVSPNPDKIKALPFAAMIKYLDFFNIMTYDFQASAWGAIYSGPQSNVYTVEPYAHFSVDLAVQAFLGYGVPASKIMIGVPMYSDIMGNTTCLNCTTSGPGSDLYNALCPSGQCDYRTLPWANATEVWDSASKSTYSIDTYTLDMFTYDSIYSVYEKCQYVWDHGLAGMIAWEMSEDVRDPTSKRSLMAAMNRCLAKDPRKNQGTPCDGSVPIGCSAASGVATCGCSGVWEVTACPAGQVCQGEGSNIFCGGL